MEKKKVRDYLESCEEGSTPEIIDYTDEAIAAAVKEKPSKPPCPTPNRDPKTP